MSPVILFCSIVQLDILFWAHFLHWICQILRSYNTFFASKWSRVYAQYRLILCILKRKVYRKEFFIQMIKVRSINFIRTNWMKLFRIETRFILVQSVFLIILITNIIFFIHCEMVLFCNEFEFQTIGLEIQFISTFSLE